MTVRIELVPTLERCIETTARSEFSEAASDYMQSDGEDRELEEKVGLLRMFLESTDFRELRRRSEEHLVRGEKVRFILYLDEGKPKYEMRIEG